MALLPASTNLVRIACLIFYCFTIKFDHGVKVGKCRGEV